jgi:hypothetical protein
MPGGYTMPGNDDNKILRDLGGLQALNNYINSTNAQKDKSIEVSKKFSYDIKSRRELAKEMENYLNMMCLSASNTTTLAIFVDKVKYLIWVLRNPILKPSDMEETVTHCITQIMQALCDAISGNFVVKEYIQNAAFASLLKNVSVLDNNILIPDAVNGILAQLKDTAGGN